MTYPPIHRLSTLFLFIVVFIAALAAAAPAYAATFLDDFEGVDGGTFDGPWANPSSGIGGGFSVSTAEYVSPTHSFEATVPPEFSAFRHLIIGTGQATTSTVRLSGQVMVLSTHPASGSVNVANVAMQDVYDNGSVSTKPTLQFKNDGSVSITSYGGVSDGLRTELESNAEHFFDNFNPFFIETRINAGVQEMRVSVNDYITAWYPLTTTYGYAWVELNAYVDPTGSYVYYDDIEMFTDGDVPVDPGSCLLGDFGTCINTVQPANNETISTSTPTTIGADGYISPDDFLYDEARIRIKLDRQTDQQAVGALIAWEAAFGNWTTFDISSSGAFDVSTTAVESLLGANREGEWWMFTVIEVPDLVIFGNVVSWKQIESYRSIFLYGELTGIDVIQNAGETVLEGIVSTADPFANCQFDLGDILDLSQPENLITCVLGITSSLIIPNQAQLQAIFDAQKNEFLTKPPFAYVYLTGQSLLGYNTVGTTTITNSNLTITFPDTGAFASSSAGSIAGSTITFIDWSLLASNLDTEPVHEGMDGLYDFINLMMSVGFLFWMWWFGTRFMAP